ncbi:MAG TPA: GNAT family N-acetyltransferase [Granulicella sp.]
MPQDASPVLPLERLGRMLRGSDLIVTARDGDTLVGVSRALTDFAYCCYLVDLAVDISYQRQGIGRRLIAETRARAGEETTLILTASPAVEEFYPAVGMSRVPSCWSIPRAR